MTPDLQACILCEEVRQELNGNFMLIGILGGITVPALPITAGKLCLFTRWCCGVGSYRQSYRILAPDNESIIASSQNDFQITTADIHITHVVVFGNVQFQQPGTYWVEVSLDKEMVLRFPLLVRVVPPAK